jgi:DNA-binding IclR family transcriptional regulator
MRMHMPMPRPAPPPPAPTWTFLSNHAHVLICLARDTDLRMRDLAAAVGITERAIQRIVADLIAAGILRAERTGRRNHYTIVDRVALRHPVEAHRTVRDLLGLIR